MEKLIAGFLIALGARLLIALAAFVGGTIVYLIWPIAIPAIFPGLIKSGVLASQVAWWPAVCFTWLCGILIKSSQTNKND